MPDLITHVAIAHLIRRPLEIRRKDSLSVPLRILFYIGTIFPDILTRPWYILFPASHDWTFPLHTPIGALLACGLLALLFEPAIRKRAFAFLTAGAGLHFLLDIFQKQTVGGYTLLFPVSWKQFTLGLFRPRQFMTAIPLWIGLVVLLEIGMHLFRKRASWYPSTSNKSE
jgi:hypothetical protein